MIRIILVLLTFFVTGIKAQNIDMPQLKQGLYKGDIVLSEPPSIRSGYYWLKSDSSFVQVDVGSDSMVLHVAKGIWYINSNGALSVKFEECPIHTSPYNKVAYQASNLTLLDSARINVSVRTEKGDIVPLYFVFVDDTMHTIAPQAKGNLVGKFSKGTIVLPGKKEYHHIRISAYDRSSSYFDETEIPLMPGFNVHDIELEITHEKLSWANFRPMKKGEAKEYSFTFRLAQMKNKDTYDFIPLRMFHQADDANFLHSILNRAVKQQPEYKDYFLWALESL